ncbi:hypothetical protein Plhal304r1_c003g0011721 [Plasmopara halstedii]
MNFSSDHAKHVLSNTQCDVFGRIKSLVSVLCASLYVVSSGKKAQFCTAKLSADSDDKYSRVILPRVTRGTTKRIASKRSRLNDWVLKEDLTQLYMNNHEEKGYASDTCVKGPLAAISEKQTAMPITHGDLSAVVCGQDTAIKASYAVNLKKELTTFTSAK